MNSNQADPLAGLRDIYLPDVVSFWPPAPGWWLALAFVLALAAGIHLYRRARRRSLKRAALVEMASIESRYADEADASHLALQLSILLRRVALQRFARREVASLHGEDWSKFLLDTSGRVGLTTNHAVGLTRAIYAGRHARLDEDAPAEWIAAARRWIRGNT
jgi:hypothetical protein